MGVLAAALLFAWGLAFVFGADGASGDSLEAAEKASLIAEARQLFSAHRDGVVSDGKSEGRVTYVTLRQGQDALDYVSIVRLRPRKVFLTADGVYIRLGSRFVEEWGYFIPTTEGGNESQFLENADPSYRRVGDSIYWYRIRG